MESLKPGLFYKSRSPVQHVRILLFFLLIAGRCIHPPLPSFPSTIQPFLFFLRLTCCSQNTSRNFWDGVPAVVLVYSHLPLIPANPRPAPLAGNPSLRLRNTWQRKKKRSAVDDFSSVSWGPGLRRPEPRLLAVTRGFAPPRFCLSPLCPAEDWLQRIVLVCCGRLFSETRSTLRTHRRSISPVQTNPRRQAWATVPRARPCAEFKCPKQWVL